MTGKPMPGPHEARPGTADAVLIFSPAELLPACWLDLAGDGPVRTFNPALWASAPGYLLAYRVVLPDGRRRLALCRLDWDLAVVPDSPRPLSDLLTLPAGQDYQDHARSWFADPRFVRWDGRLLLHWNSGCHEPRNHQFAQEIDPATLSPRGGAFELVKAGGQFRIEKNWGLFAQGDELFATYSLGPFRLLRLSRIGGGLMEFGEVGITGWDDTAYAERHGEPRGGGPPVLVDGRYYVFHHSRFGTSTGIRYVAGVLGFSGRAPFAPEVFTARPLPLPNPFGGRFAHPRLNPSVDRVVYPCGAVHEAGAWLVSYGINDEHCAVARLDHARLVRTMSATRRLERHPERPWDHALTPPAPRRKWLWPWFRT